MGKSCGASLVRAARADTLVRSSTVSKCGESLIRSAQSRIALVLASSVPPRILQYLLATYLPPSPSIRNMHKEDGYSLSQYGANEYALLPLASIGFAWATVQEIFLCITCCALAFKMKLHRVVGFLAMVRVNCVCVVCCALCGNHRARHDRH